jgi:hypothetical protein
MDYTLSRRWWRVLLWRWGCWRPPQRVITQIAAAPLPESCSEAAVVFALCNDGSLWHRGDSIVSKWIRLPPIPQPHWPRPEDFVQEDA